MKDKYLFPPVASKYILRSTSEEVEIVDFDIKERGARSDEDWVTYIDSDGKEHIREHLNIQLDFKPVVNDTFNKLIDIAKPHITTTRNNRIFDVAKELFFNRGYSPMAATSKAIELVDTVGIETE